MAKRGEKGPTGPRIRPILTARQVEKLQPFKPALLKRYRQITQTGSSDLRDPICAKANKGDACGSCPVYWPTDGGDFRHCSEYLPSAPECVDDRDDCVTVARGGKCDAENVEAAKAYGAAVVTWLEGLPPKATGEGVTR